MAAAKPAFHEAARQGFGAAVIGAYEKGRPEHHEEFVRLLLHKVGVIGSPACVNPTAVPVLELGAGTGKYTRVLHKVLSEYCGAGERSAAAGAARAPWLITADPADMASNLAAALPGVPFHQTTADHLEAIPSASVGTVIAAQAFHWFADAPSVTETLRVLRPGGHFIVVWNMRDRGAVQPWMADFEALLDEYYHPDTPRQHSGAWRAALAVPGFTPIEGMSLPVPGGYVGDEGRVLDYVLSISDISRRPQQEKEAIVARFRALLHRPDVLATTTVRAGDGAPLYTIPLATEMYWVRKVEG